jgi:hypothetical protein
MMNLRHVKSITYSNTLGSPIKIRDSWPELMLEVVYVDIPFNLI